MIYNINGNEKRIYDIYNPDFFKELNDSFKSPYAMDYASDIINYEKLTFAGGSRFIEIEIGTTNNKIKDEFNNILNENDFKLIILKG